MSIFIAAMYLMYNQKKMSIVKPCQRPESVQLTHLIPSYPTSTRTGNAPQRLAQGSDIYLFYRFRQGVPIAKAYRHPPHAPDSKEISFTSTQAQSQGPWNDHVHEKLNIKRETAFAKFNCCKQGDVKGGYTSHNHTVSYYIDQQKSLRQSRAHMRTFGYSQYLP